MDLPKVLTISVCIPKARAFKSGCMDLVGGAKTKPSNIANKRLSLVLVHHHRPEQHDVSRRAPAGWNKGPHNGQGHVEFKDVVAVILPGTLTQRGGHVHTRRYHLLDAGAVVKRLMRQTWQTIFSHRSWEKFRQTSFGIGLEAICFFSWYFWLAEMWVQRINQSSLIKKIKIKNCSFRMGTANVKLVFVIFLGGA